MKIKEILGTLKSKYSALRSKNPEHEEEQKPKQKQEEEPVKHKPITEEPPKSGLCLLLSIPPEIRLMIYEYLLISKRPNKEILFPGPWERAKYPTDICPGILAVCRKINDEARDIVYTQNKFKFNTPYLCGMFIIRIQPELYNLVRYVHMQHRAVNVSQPRELAREWDCWLSPLIGFRNLRSVTFDIDYKILLPADIAHSWRGNPERLGLYNNWEAGLLQCIGESYANWHKGIKLASCVTSYISNSEDMDEEHFHVAYKRATYHWIDAGEEGKKEQEAIWRNTKRQRISLSRESENWHQYICRQLPSTDSREIELIRWPSYIDLQHK
jgi:hypothetical protein